MRPEDILELLRKHPFEPFRIHRSDGVAYDVRHPDMAIVPAPTSPLFARGDEGVASPLVAGGTQGGRSPSPAPKVPTAPFSTATVTERARLRATVNCALIHITRTETVNRSTTRGVSRDPSRVA